MWTKWFCLEIFLPALHFAFIFNKILLLVFSMFYFILIIEAYPEPGLLYMILESCLVFPYLLPHAPYAQIIFILCWSLISVIFFYHHSELCCHTSYFSYCLLAVMFIILYCIKPTACKSSTKNQSKVPNQKVKKIELRFTQLKGQSEIWFGSPNLSSFYF